MEQNHELPSSFQETERCFYVCRSGCGRIAFRYRYSPNALLCAYFLFPQYDAKLLTVQWTEENTMAIDVPGPVAAYLAGEVAKDADAISCCFTEDGSVHDEGRDYRGRDAIRQWKQAADEKYRYALQMVNAQTHGNEVTVRELDHIFK